MKAFAIAILLVVTLSALSRGGEIADLYSKESRDKERNWGKSRNFAEAASTNHGVSEIGIERVVAVMARAPSIRLLSKAMASSVTKVRISWNVRESSQARLRD